MDTESMALSVTRVEATFPSLFSMSGGCRHIFADTSDRAVNLYLPPPTTGTELRIVLVGDGSYGLTVKASSRAPVAGSTKATFALADPGDSLHLVPDDDASDWLAINPTTIVR